MYLIYLHKTPENKVYVGCTSKTIQERKRLGYTGTFGEIVVRFGWNNIETTILAETESQEESARLEDEYIRKYKATDNRFGYNRAKGIGGKTEICKSRLSTSAYKAHSNPDTHQKLCLAQKIAQNRPDVRQKKSTSSRDAMTKPGMHEKLSKSAKKAWSNPEIRERFVKAHSGKKWVHLGDKSKQIRPELLDDYLSQGWELGRAFYQMPKRKKN